MAWLHRKTFSRVCVVYFALKSEFCKKSLWLVCERVLYTRTCYGVLYPKDSAVMSFITDSVT